MCPLDRSRFFDPTEAAAVCALMKDDPSEQSNVAEMIGELVGVTRFWAVLHSEGLSHYTLLECKYDVASWKRTYFDALKVCSSALTVAKKFAHNLLLGGVVAPPVNKKFQSDGWSWGCCASTGWS